MSTQLYLRSPAGVLLTIISDFVKLEYARAENKVGYMYLDLAPDTVDTSLFSLDCRLEVWRTVGANAPYLDGETIYFVRKWGWKVDEHGRELFSVEAKDPIYLIQGRIAPYPPNHTYDEISNLPADDALVTIMQENMGTEARNPAGALDTARDLSTYLTIKTSPALGPNIYKQYSFRNILDVMQEIVSLSLAKGKYLSFDIVYTSPTMLEFRTYAICRGIHHGHIGHPPILTNPPPANQLVIISPEAGNLIEPEWVEDHTEEITRMYISGTDTSDIPLTETIHNPNPPVYASPFNLRESYMDGYLDSTTDFTHDEGEGELWEHGVKKYMAGKLTDTDSCIYGVHYRFGDIVWAEYRGHGFNAHVDAIHVTVEQGKETIDNRIRAEL